MRAPIVRRWQSLVSSIHPVLPLSAKESHQVLNLMRHQFRQQLDQLHPSDDQHGAHMHFRSLFKSPLLLRDYADCNPPEDHSKAQTLWKPADGDLRNNLVPAAALQSRIATANADMSFVKRCLKAQLEHSLTKKDKLLSMRDSQICSSVLHWLWASGVEQSTRFLEDAHFLHLIVPFIVAESRHERLYQWIARLQAIGDLKAHRVIGHCHLHLVQAEVQYGSGLGPAIKIFTDRLEAVKKDQPDLRMLRPMFSAAGRYLCDLTTSRAQSTAITAEQYEMIYTSIPSWSRPHSFESACLALHNPHNPRSGPTLLHLRHVNTEYLQSLSKDRRRRTVVLALECAENLIASDHIAHATWVIEALKTYFSAELGYEENNSLRDVDEQSSIKLLGKLAMQPERSLSLGSFASSPSATSYEPG